MSVSPHLEGRAPHGEVAALLSEAPRCATEEDVRALGRKIGHIANLFVALLRDFSANVLRSEEKRGRPPPAPKRQPRSDGWAPFDDAFSGVELGSEEVRVKAGTTLRELKGWDVHGYDPVASGLISVVVHDRLDVLRGLSDSGVDVRRWMRLPCHAGGGLHVLLEDNLKAYIWANQLLLHGDEIDIASPHNHLYSPVLPTQETVAALRADPARCRYLYLSQALRELTGTYDNRSFRGAAASEHLIHRLWKERALSPVELRAHCKDVLFPELYRIVHALRYNAVRVGGLPYERVTDSADVEGDGGKEVSEIVRGSLGRAVLGLMQQQIQGESGSVKKAEKAWLLGVEGF